MPHRARTPSPVSECKRGHQAEMGSYAAGALGERTAPDDATEKEVENTRAVAKRADTVNHRTIEPSEFNDRSHGVGTCDPLHTSAYIHSCPNYSATYNVSPQSSLPSRPWPITRAIPSQIALAPLSLPSQSAHSADTDSSSPHSPVSPPSPTSSLPPASSDPRRRANTRMAGWKLSWGDTRPQGSRRSWMRSKGVLGLEDLRRRCGVILGQQTAGRAELSYGDVASSKGINKSSGAAGLGLGLRAEAHRVVLAGTG